MISTAFFKSSAKGECGKGIGAEADLWRRSCWQQEIRFLLLSQKCGELSKTKIFVEFSTLLRFDGCSIGAVIFFGGMKNETDF